MTQSDVRSSTTIIGKYDVDEILIRYDSFICVLARKYISRSITSAEVLDMDIDDLVQISRIRLWFALQKQEIRNMKAFIGRIVHNEAINMVRQHRPVGPLVMNDEGELYGAYTLIAAGQGIQDPADDIEQEEMLQSYSGKLTEYVPKLPPQQQRAMICALKDQIADILPLADLFLSHGIDVENMHWSETASELQSERTSLSVARKKLRAHRKEAMDC